MEEFIDFKLVEKVVASRMLELTPYEDAFVLLNFKGELASSTLFPAAVFHDEELAKKRLKEWKEADIHDVFLEKGSIFQDQVRLPTKGDLTLPQEPEAREIAQDVLYAALDVLEECPSTGGCHTFYTPAQWKEKGEKHGTEDPCKLLIVHDGGDFANLCDYGHTNYTLMDSFKEELEKRGYWLEQATGWYSCLYRTEDTK